MTHQNKICQALTMVGLETKLTILLLELYLYLPIGGFFR